MKFILGTMKCQFSKMEKNYMWNVQAGKIYIEFLLPYHRNVKMGKYHVNDGEIHCEVPGSVYPLSKHVSFLLGEISCEMPVLWNGEKFHVKCVGEIYCEKPAGITWNFYKRGNIMWKTGKYTVKYQNRFEPLFTILKLCFGKFLVKYQLPFW